MANYMSYIPLKGHKISTANSTTSLLGASATFTGAFEYVRDYTTLGVAINATVPTSGTNLAYIRAARGITQQSVYTVPANKTAWIKKIKVSVGQTNSADVELYENLFADDISAPYTSVKLFKWGVEDYTGSQDFKFDSYLSFAEKTDIYFEAKRVTGAGTAQVSVHFDFILTNN